MASGCDTGAELRSLYEPTGGVRAIFSAKVADYIASRPGYPPALFEMLAERCGLASDAVIVDLGAGTGLLTQGLLEAGCRVIAVEPNLEMRAAADQRLGRFERYASVDGSAESIPLEGLSVDLITAAQAFHWFDVERARDECARVLRSEGKVALIWNDRVLSDPLHVALDEVFAEVGGAKRAALVAHQERSNVGAFFGSDRAEEFDWPNTHPLDRTGLLSLVFSRSYMPQRQSPEGAEVERRIGRIFERFAENGTVDVRYTTVAIVGRPRT